MKTECPDCLDGEVTAAGSGTLVPTRFGPRRAPWDDGEPAECRTCGGTGEVEEPGDERRHEQQRPHLHRRAEDALCESDQRPSREAIIAARDRRRVETFPSLHNVLARGDGDGLPVRVESERLPGHRLVVRDRRTPVVRHQVTDWPDFPAIGPITTAVRGLDEEAWR